MDHISLPKNYRFKVSPGFFKGTVCIQLQKRGLVFWNTSSQSSYGMFKGQNLNEESILAIESKLWKEYKDTEANQQWIKDNL